MAKIDGDDRELNDTDASLIKGMLKRGDAQHHVAAYFGVDSRAVSHINTRKTFGSVPAASVMALPPPGPYRPDPIYVAFFQEMARVNQLWNERKLKEAKARLERALKSPAIPLEQSAIEELADDFFRDEFGILKDFDE